MLRTDDRITAIEPSVSSATIKVCARDEIADLAVWQKAFARERKDRRFYEILEDTLKGTFTYGYLRIDRNGSPAAIQPYFLLDQDLLAGMGGHARAIVAVVRRLWPRFMYARTMMMGCVAGEGHLDGEQSLQLMTAVLLARELTKLARKLKCAMVVFKEFPAKYRPSLQSLLAAGFTRVPSMPMTTLNIEYKDFDDYLSKALSPRTRGKTRRKLRDADRAKPAIAMSVVDDVAPIVDDIYPLYESVYERSPLQFEKLTKAFFCEIAERMPDKVRFFVWRQDTRIIAFGLCTVHGDEICHDYVGFDYAVAFELNLYYRVYRDIIEWAIANGYKRFYSGSLNYDPKWHLRQSLYPVDLYVRHVSNAINAVLRLFLPLMEPTRSDPILRQFHNYRDLWGEGAPRA
jgi:predicted N-acyltransferase